MSALPGTGGCGLHFILDKEGYRWGFVLLKDGLRVGKRGRGCWRGLSKAARGRSIVSEYVVLDFTSWMPRSGWNGKPFTKSKHCTELSIY